jgi:hypothetical protein
VQAPANRLKEAVRFAQQELATRMWLLDPNGGAVPERNLSLVLGPDPARAPPAGFKWTQATNAGIINAIDLMLQKSGGQGERFFFHFSGHGLTSRIDFRSQSAIVAGDFTSTLTTNSLTVVSLFELFKGTEFAEQYFFIDACRNIPFDTEKRLGEYPNPRPETKPVRPQFIIFATQPGFKANEIHKPSNEQGAFTGALLRGLGGQGGAKRWDEAAGEYVVRWNSLFEFVERDVVARALAAGQTDKGPIIQRPQQYGERGSQNPELGRFGAEEVVAENLEVRLAPTAIAASADIVVGELAGVVEHKQPPLAVPVNFRLAPRTYSVRAAAPGFVCRRRCVQVDLYQSETVTLELEPGQPPGPAVSESAFRDLLTRGLEGATALGSLTVDTADPLATVEVAEASGQVIASGRPPLVLRRPPGFYRGRLISPEGETREQLIELEAGGVEHVLLASPTERDPLLLDLVQRTGIPITSDHMVHTSEAVGPAASAQSSTILALAAAAAMETDSAYGQKLRSLGIPAFLESAEPRLETGVQLILGDANAKADTWNALQIRVWPILDRVPAAFERAAPLSGMVAVATAALGREPGAYWVWLKLSETGNLLFPVSVLPGSVSLVVMTRDQTRGMVLHQYMPLLPDAATESRAKSERFRDPKFKDSRFPAIRRIEIMQRLAAAGRITPALPDIDALLYDKWRDPMAGCLGAYLLIRLGRTGELEVPARNLTQYFGGLPDSHVLRGAWLDIQEAGAARAAYLDALDAGLPVFRDGLMLLMDAVRRFDIAHERVPLLDDLLRHVPAGTLWSASQQLIKRLAETAPLESGKSGGANQRRHGA